MNLIKKVQVVLAKGLSSSFQSLPVDCLSPAGQPSHPLAASPAHPMHGSITLTSCMPAFGELTGPSPHAADVDSKHPSCLAGT